MIEISKRQAQDFARSIFADIAEYIASHEAEYIKFLEEARSNEN